MRLKDTDTCCVNNIPPKIRSILNRTAARKPFVFNYLGNGGFELLKREGASYVILGSVRRS